MAALLAGQLPSEVAEQFHLPKSTVRSWARKVHQVRPKKDDTNFGDLVAGYLRADLISLTAQAELFADRAWLEKQSASELAVLHGVSADKAFRLLAALESIAPEEHPDDADGGSSSSPVDPA